MNDSDQFFDGKLQFTEGTRVVPDHQPLRDRIVPDHRPHHVVPDHRLPGDRVVPDHQPLRDRRHLLLTVEL